MLHAMLEMRWLWALHSAEVLTVCCQKDQIRDLQEGWEVEIVDSDKRCRGP
jgi:hypothetical protein